MTETNQIKRALISVADKNGVIELAHALEKHGVEIIATGGTADLLRSHNLQCIDVSEYTGFPEIMQGRVKTLHPKIFAGLLGRRIKDADVMAAMAISPIDLVIVNLYPFHHVINQPNHQLTDAIEQIDIGGVSLIRAAAKNYHEVVVVVDPSDYHALITDLIADKNQLTYTKRLTFAKKAFAYTAWYDGMIANYFGTLQSDDIDNSNVADKGVADDSDKVGKQQIFPDYLTVQFRKREDLRYGENPHQKAALYLNSDNGPIKQPSAISVATATQVQGKALSYNNIADADTAFECAQTFVEMPACVIVKHANPCGAAIGSDVLEAYQLAYRADPTSAFGGIIAFNREVDVETANKIIKNQFVEVIIAPAYANDALTLLATKPFIRVLRVLPEQISNNQLANNNYSNSLIDRLSMHRIEGGVLVQTTDDISVSSLEMRVVTERYPSSQELNDVIFAWQVAKFVKSNAIVYASKGATLGIGAGQMSRIYSARIAVMKAAEAGLSLIGSVMASDAFFPFRDSVDTAAANGITAIIQPGGSIRDEEIIAAANQADIAMVFTGIRHFRH